MDGLIRASLKNPIAVTVMVLALVVLGGLSAYSIPVDILPVFKSPAVQALVFYSGMPAASIEKNITARLERGVVQASGGRRIESRSIVGISIVRDYFRSNVDRSGALTEVEFAAPAGNIPRCRRARFRRSSCPTTRPAPRRSAWSRWTARRDGEATLFDIGRYEVRPHDHVAAGRPGAPGLRRQGPRDHGVSRPHPAPGPPPLAAWTC